MSIDMSMQMRRAGADPLADHPEIGGYRVVEGPHGTALYGMIPVSDLLGIQATWEAKGYTIWDLGVAKALGATIAATDPEGAKAWRAEIEARVAREVGDDHELAWVRGCDTGLSSLCIMACLATSGDAGNRAAQRLYTMGDGGAMWRHPPRDPDDLGRCIRLLDRFPEWRERLAEVAEINPEWVPFVRQWAELEALYRHELPSGACPRTYARMQALTEESRPSSEATIDLSALETPGEPGERTGPYFDASTRCWGVMIDRHEELPERLYVTIPPSPGARVLMWSRDGGEATVERAVRRATQRGDEDA